MINEIMYNPPGTGNEPDHEWFEVKNVSGLALNADGCVISSTNDTSHTIASGTTIASGAYFVFGRSSSITGVSVDYPYGTSGNIRLNNNSDSVTITCGATTVDSVSYGTSAPWPSNTDGKSISFGVISGGSAADLQNDNASNWGHSTSTCCGGSGKGTPGAVNDDVLGPTAITLSSFTPHSVQSVAESGWPLAALFRSPMAGLMEVAFAAMAASLAVLRRRRPS